jgi:phosphatidylglycerophosphate synthase
MTWTPNKVTFLRVGVGFVSVGLFGRNAWLNLVAVVLTGAFSPPSGKTAEFQ